MNWYTAYRPVWLILNLFLIGTIVTAWYHMNPKVIKIDLEHINAKTATAVKGSTVEIGGRNDAPTGGDMSFCAWVEEHTANLDEPFKSLKAADCAKKSSISLHDFATHGMHKLYTNRSIWDVYAFGSNQNDGQIFKDGTELTVPDVKQGHAWYSDYPILLGPDMCAARYLKWVGSLQMGLSFTAFFYLLLHGVHMFVASTPNTTPTVKMVNELALIGMSVIVYIFVIIVYVIDRRSPIFYKCAWITEWFQDEMFMLYGITITYLILGIVGLLLICVHVFVMYSQKAKADANTGVYATISNLVPDPQTSLFGVP